MLVLQEKRQIVGSKTKGVVALRSVCDDPKLMAAQNIYKWKSIYSNSNVVTCNVACMTLASLPPPHSPLLCTCYILFVAYLLT